VAIEVAISVQWSLLIPEATVELFSNMPSLLFLSLVSHEYKYKENFYSPQIF
jgi:hypothetical protein